LLFKLFIQRKLTRDVFADMMETGKSADTIIDEKGLKQVTDTGAIEAIIDEVLSNNPSQVEAYKGGNEKLLGFFVGQVMKSSGGKANPAMVNELLKGKLG
jgi:aspartyl-tRNA(Asn)/glutamyl-tRNA(Gln) amidotransferase subunit B